MTIQTMFVTKDTVKFADLDGDATRSEYLHAWANEGRMRSDMRVAELDLAEEINRTKVESVTDGVVQAYYAINGKFPSAKLDILRYVENANDYGHRENLYHALKAVKYLNNKGLLNFGPAQTQNSIDYFKENGVEDVEYYRDAEGV